jgi:hypothetical protein
LNFNASLEVGRKASEEKEAAAITLELKLLDKERKVPLNRKTRLLVVGVGSDPQVEGDG